MPLLENPVQAGTAPALGALGGAIPGRDWLRLRQPFLDSRGRACVMHSDLGPRMRGRGGFTRNDSRGGERRPLVRAYVANDLRNLGYPVPNVVNAATLTIRDWIELDKTIVPAYRQRLRAAADLEAANPYGGFNAMGRTTLERQVMSDPGEAFVDMDAVVDGRTDTPLFDLESLPLPITHADFGYTRRQLEVSQNGGQPFDSIMIEACSRRIGESIEDQTIGNVTGMTYGTQSVGYGAHRRASTVFGYTNFTPRLTKTNFTTPTTTNGPTTYAEVLAALSQLYAQYSYGPFILYHSIDWTQYMDSPFSTAGGNHPGETLRTMLMKIPDIQDVRRLDRLTSTYTLIFVAMVAETAQMVNGLEITTIQWEEKGGLDNRWKILCIKVPRLGSDYSNRTGILHGTTA